MSTTLNTNQAVLANLGLTHLAHCTELTLHMLPRQLPRVTATLDVVGVPSDPEQSISYKVLELSVNPTTPAFDLNRECAAAMGRLHKAIARDTDLAHRSIVVSFVNARRAQELRWMRESLAASRSRRSV